MNDSLFKLLQSVDTPTVCNAIEVAQGKRGFDDFTRGTMQCSAPGTAMVGYARTARIQAVNPPTESPEVIKARRMAYYKYMAEGPRPAVAVVQDMDVPNAIGAYWGEINTNVHKAFGMTGALTDGVMRDLGDLPDGFVVLAGSVGPSHGFVHVIDFDEPVQVMGMRVTPGDLIHADRHGGVVIPQDAIPHLEGAIRQLFKSEKVVLDATKGKRIGFAEFEAAWAAFETSRT
ncbi:RraA family protein [Sulfitobacter sp. M57]|uniref:RraA family protein n=1 Tax=unclassified Sulfitobacter TaxID=196795 RepID=UPI0023E24A7C|nr:MULTISPECIES: RraA family protein [unclassified Sulfitobacter]MDF3415707.1 RraA family protein [Sulfitobacter sp. KE5]MDF3423187.1 RraA family protein [Sulfitobacter sp. KE43]MDF3434253.1 RraA family protein [Sulfitobacter sp. KE42]MDF3459714.1 RraA family protein [Sulfitobacter sp. S74]MDF3463791.1 RraA family protein [Sulfitobacter sp. Ks18]